MKRSFYMKDIDPYAIKAKLEGGLLLITVPKLVNEPDKHRIDIQ